ncbi:hypothetical protein OSTOST_19453, partial [Ostertagia ostertagi]
MYNNGSSYVWDRPNGVAPLPLTQDQQYWKGGGAAPPYDPNTACVYWDGDATGLLAPVARRWRLCVRSISTKRNYPPSKRGDDDLPPGKWSMTIAVNPSGDQPEICSVSVRMQSSLQVVAGFTTNIASDYPAMEPKADSGKANRIISYVHPASSYGHQTPVLTHALLSDPYDATFYNAATYEARAGCAFSWMTQTFSCPKTQSVTNDFMIAHVGEDEFGYLFQRLTRAHCTQADIP